MAALELEVRHIRVPFRFQYGHARKSHTGLEAVICIAKDGDGATGLGEAVPRTYVTGETCATVMASIPAVLKRTTTSLDDDASVWQAERQNLAAAWEGAFPSCAFCAVDSAIHELLARRADKSCFELMSGSTTHEPLVYSASIGISKRWKLIATLLLYRMMGFRHFKVKVAAEEDIERIRLIRRVLGTDVSLFADANAVWSREQAIRLIEQLAAYNVWAIEEPLRAVESPATAHGDKASDALSVDRHRILRDAHYENYRWLRERSPIPLIADESLICMRTAQQIVAHQAFDIFNVRLSKCGGPWVSAAVLELARENDLRFAQGAMVGETPILATAGAHFAAVHSDRLYVQGFSHRLLHGRRFASGEPKMRRGGRVTFDPVRPGLGLRLDWKQLDKLTLARETHQV